MKIELTFDKEKIKDRWQRFVNTNILRDLWTGFLICIPFGLAVYYTKGLAFLVLGLLSFMWCIGFLWNERPWKIKK